MEKRKAGKRKRHLPPSVAAAAMEGRPALSPSRFADSYAGRGEGEKSVFICVDLWLKSF
jgi:hypothetical protein